MKCIHCRIGHYQNEIAPYLEWLYGEMLLIPDVPIHVCDICGHMKYDALFLANLQHMKEQLSLPPIGDGSRAILTMARPLSNWREVRRRRG